MLWRLRCGKPGRDVPPKYGNWNTIYRRFRRWSEAGGWVATTASIAPRFAPLFRQRAEKGIHRRDPGRSRRGGFNSKLHCLADARGRPLPPNGWRDSRLQGL
nr:transposase [[Ochrobactrum] quorumnocens]